MHERERALIEKTEHENGWENVGSAGLGAASRPRRHHPGRGRGLEVELPGGRPIRELARSLQVEPDGDGRCAVFGMDGLTGEKVSDRSYKYTVALLRSGLQQL